MRLNNKEFKRLKELEAKPDRSSQEEDEYRELKAKKEARDNGGKSGFKPGNDFAWWSKEPVLLKDAVNLPLNWIPGTALVPGTQTESGKPGAPTSVLVVNIINTYGSEDSSTGPFNLTARGLYLAMHRKYRGLNAYQAADIGMVLISTIELFALIATVERVYGIINYYDILNRNLPYALLAGCGISESLADNIRDNLSDFRYAINNLIKKSQNVCIPKDLSILADKIALFGYIYKDHDSKKAQSIVFKLNEVGQYTGDLANTGGGVLFKRIDWAGFTSYEDIVSILKETIDALVEDSDVLRIYSDFVSYLPEGSLMTLLPVPEDYVVLPVYSEEILHKIHNAYSTDALYDVNEEDGVWERIENGMEVRELVPGSVTLKASVTAIVERTIIQKDNVIYTKSCLYAPSSSGSVTSFTTGVVDGYTGWAFAGTEVPVCAHFGDKQLFDTYRHEADPATMLEGSLFKFVPQYLPQQHVAFVRACAWEIVRNFEVITTINGESEVDNITQFKFDTGYDTGMTANEIKSYMERYCRSVGYLSQYDWAPFVYNVIDDDLNSMFYDHKLPFAGDMDNCRVVGYNDIFRMLEVAMYSGITTTAAVQKGSGSAE